MIRSSRAFTLTELLVILAIIAVLAGLLFPVFAQAKSQAQGAQCISNFRQVSQGALLYVTDYDDGLMPVNHVTGGLGDSRTDRTWVQLTTPYTKDFRSFFCPADTSINPNLNGVFDADLVPGDTATRFFTASKHVHTGYNSQYLAPIVRFGNQWRAIPRQMASVERPSNTYLFLDSVWTQPVAEDGLRGGSWLVVPPCRWQITETATGSNVVDSFVGQSIAGDVVSINPGWNLASGADPLRYGGIAARHNGRLTVTHTDGRAEAVTTRRLADGCHLAPNWGGLIRDTDRYAWDTR